MSLTIAAALASRGVEIALELPEGETLALLGPNGAGKSTVLGMLSGLVRPDSGSARLGGDALFDLPATWTPPHRRGVALLAQDALLFPHLNVRRNVEFGPRSAGRSRAEAAAVAGEWLERTGTGRFADARPHELSGGQAQRVAIARALAAEPRLLLLDEPLAALDVAVAGRVRTMLADVLAGRTTVLVTHDALDAHLLADRVAVLHDGRVVEAGPTRRVLAHPTHPFTAEIAGLTLLTGRRTATGLVTDGGLALAGRAVEPIPVGAPVTAVVRPSSVLLDAAGGIPAIVTALEPHADLVRVRTEHLVALAPPAVVAELRLAPGSAVLLGVPPAEVAITAV